MKKTALYGYVLMLLILFCSSFINRNDSRRGSFMYAVWGIRPTSVSTQYFYPNYNNLYSSIDEILFLSFSPLSSWGYYSLDEFREDYDDGSIACVSNSNYVCMAYVKYDLTSPAYGIVLEVLDGDFERIE